MTQNEIEAAIGQRLAAGVDTLPIAWPNQSFTPTGKYVEFRHAPNTRTDPVISGGYAYQQGLFLLTLVVPAGGFATEANDIAQSIADLFPKALRLATATGKVVINEPTSFGTGFVDGAYWRQPVRISYITEESPSAAAPTIAPEPMLFAPEFSEEFA
jgi:hypothetical protein